MKITIVGCGNAGLIHAAKLIEFGHRVALLKTSATNSRFFDKIASEKGYNVLDSTNSENRFFVTPEIITRDVEKAISFADIIMVMTTTLQHEDIAKLIAPHTKDGQIICLIQHFMDAVV